MGYGEMKNKAAFLDRDGTIIIDSGYVYRIEDVIFIRGAIEAIQRLNKSNFKVIVITNQSGVARGYFSETDVKKLHLYINKELVKHKAWIDKFYYCPHHPEAKIRNYRKNCDCRKPEHGFILKAISEFGIDVKRSFVIGDKSIDICAGKKAGIKTVLITKVKNTRKDLVCRERPDWKAESLLSAVTYLLDNE